VLTFFHGKSMRFTWPTDECADQLVGTGTGVGDIAPNFTMLSQHGTEVSLHDYCDRAVLLIGSAFWCEGCREEAPTLEPLYQEYKDQGLMIMTLLIAMEFKHSIIRVIDRHENIGKGMIGGDGFKRILGDRRFGGIPKILETPKEDDMDRTNLKVLRRLGK